LARPYRDSANRRLAKHLQHERPYIFTYLYCLGLDATNNVAERAVRTLIGARKNWGGNRTQNGARVQAVLTSILQTAKQQGKNSMSWWNYCVAERSKRFSTSYRQPRKRPAIPGTTHRLRSLFPKSSMPTLWRSRSRGLRFLNPVNNDVTFTRCDRIPL
jgi:hypothetical protein